MNTSVRLPPRLRAVRSLLLRRVFSITLDHPVVTLAAIVLLLALLGAFAGRFQLDASADSLVLENDKALEYYRSIQARYGSDDYLVVTYAPERPLFAAQTLSRIKSLRDEVEKLDYVASVTTLLDVPLLRSPPVTFSQLRQNTHTLLSAETDIELAQEEFKSSPLYKNLLVSTDGNTAGIYIDFNRDERFYDLLNERNALRERQLRSELAPEEEARLNSVTRKFKAHSSRLNQQTGRNVAEIRGILDKYRDNAEIHLAGIPMIVSDIIRFIWHDLQVFGIGVLCLMVLLLAMAFRSLRWVVIPVFICIASAIAMVGGLGLIKWPLTVVSSNFLSVLLIITLSLTIHLIVRYEELRGNSAGKTPRALISNAVRDKFAPCLYTALTTIVAFGSLMVSGIRPVIDFGWMMVAGIVFSFVLTFCLFPSFLILLPVAEPVKEKRGLTSRVTLFLSELIDHRATATLVIAALLFVIGLIGITRLSVENRFIDYFGSSTEIHQGMVAVDRELGGTSPLDVIIDPDSKYLSKVQRNTATSADAINDRQEAGGSGGLSGSSYWFNIFRLDDAKQIHDYLSSLPEIGKVLSVATSIRLMEQVNGNTPLDNFTLSIAYKSLPDDIKKRLFKPYMSRDGNQLRFSTRIFETRQNLKRGELIKKIKGELVQRFHLEPQQIHVTGMTVLYNNMLESLFRSLLASFVFVLIAVFAMFMVLFRSVLVSFIALVPNLLVATMVLGLMGWFRIPLDLMTITIASIAMGIAVDDTIHYIHRFKVEFETDRQYWKTIKRCHKSIGRAIVYTSITITLGFSILVLSDFVPTIYFGVLAGAAMMSALVADLTVLPALLATFKPFGSNASK